MKTYPIILLALVSLFMHACIQDDFVDDEVDPILRINESIDSLEINTSYQYEATYLNNVGSPESVDIVWSSSDSEIIEMTEDGLATAKAEGSATITASFDDGNRALEATNLVHVGDNTTIVEQASIMGFIETTTFYDLEGDFIYEETETGTRLSFADNYVASAGLPGLYIYLSNNRNSIANALEIGGVETFSGAHSYEIPDVGLMDYQFIVYFCKPFNVKVGDGEF